MSDDIIKEGFYVAGVKFHNFDSIKDIIEVGDTVDLIPEPNNEYDPNAIAVKYKTVMIGYIPSKLTKFIYPLLDLEMCCEVVEVNLNEKPWKQLKVAMVE